MRLKEVLERGEAVGYAANPWKEAAGLGLTPFLAEPMDAYRAALGRCGEAAAAADATADPQHPPFAPDADPTPEAERRRQVAAKLADLLPVPPEVARHWVKQPAAAVASARAERAKAAAWVETVKAGPPDAALLATQRQGVSASTPAPSPDSLATDQKTLAAHAVAFDAGAARYARLRAAAPDASGEVVLKWMAADPKVVASARKRLEGAAPLARAVEAGTLDASLLARFEAAPIEPAKVIESLASLGAYLDIAGKWYAVFQRAKKKAAEPVVRHFGLSLGAASAGQVRQFLSDVQKRSDLRAAVEAATGEPFARRPDDAELLAAHAQHLAVVTALAAPAGSAPAGATPAEGVGEPAAAPRRTRPAPRPSTACSAPGPGRRWNCSAATASRRRAMPPAGWLSSCTARRPAPG